jgi:hypothetical protein
MKKIVDFASQNNEEKLLVQVDEKMIIADKLQIEIYNYKLEWVSNIYRILNIYRKEFQSGLIEVNFRMTTLKNDINNSYYNCICGNKYCLIYENDPSAVFRNNLYQHCVQSYAYSKDVDNPLILLDYMNKYMELTNKYRNSVDIINSMNLNLATINNCYSNLFTPKLDNITECKDGYSIPILDKYNYDSLKEFYINQIILINGKKTRNYFTESYLKEYICAVLAKQHLSACATRNFDDSSSSISINALIVIILLIVIVNLIIIFLCRRYTSKRLQERIDDVEISTKVGQVITNYTQFKN